MAKIPYLKILTGLILFFKKGKNTKYVHEIKLSE